MTKSMCCIIENTQTDPGTEAMSPLEYLNTPKLEKMRKEGKDDNNISIQFFETVNEVLGKLKETLS